MRSKSRKPVAGPVLRTIPKELIDQYVNGPMSAEAVNAASMAFKKALIERALGAELTHHLYHAAGADKPGRAKNHRNGASAKTVLTECGPLRIAVLTCRVSSDQYQFDFLVSVDKSLPKPAMNSAGVR